MQIFYSKTRRKVRQELWDFIDLLRVTDVLKLSPEVALSKIGNQISHSSPILSRALTSEVNQTQSVRIETIGVFLSCISQIYNLPEFVSLSSQIIECQQTGQPSRFAIKECMRLSIGKELEEMGSVGSTTQYAMCVVSTIFILPLTLFIMIAPSIILSLRVNIWAM